MKAHKNTGLHQHKTNYMNKEILKNILKLDSIYQVLDWKDRIIIHLLLQDKIDAPSLNIEVHRLYIEFFSEIEDFNLQIDQTQMQIDKSGFLLKKENETLKKLMVDLLQEIQKMKFTTNTGSTINLVNQPQFLSIENRFKTFLK